MKVRLSAGRAARARAACRTPIKPSTPSPFPNVIISEVPESDPESWPQVVIVRDDENRTLHLVDVDASIEWDGWRSPRARPGRRRWPVRDRAFRPRLDGLEDRWMMSMGGGGGSSTLAPVSLAPLSVGIPTFTSLTADSLTFTVGTTGLGSGKSLLDVSVIVLDANTGKLLQTLQAQTFVSGSGADSTTGVIPLNNFAPGFTCSRSRPTTEASRFPA